MSKRYDLLVEIGCEPLPPKIVKFFQEKAKADFKNLLGGYRIKDYERITVWSSPRRLVVKVDKVSSHQREKIEQIKGPPYEIGVKDGKPTPAGLGFARNKGVEFKDLTTRDTDRGKYLFCIKKHQGRALRKFLPRLTMEFIEGLEFPVSMRWPGSDFKFPRPVRWLLVKLGAKAVRFKIGNLSSGRSSRGHYLFSDRKVIVNDIKSYGKELKRNYVIVDPQERRDALMRAIDRPLKYTDGYPVKREELLEEINNSVEYPTGVKGKFPERFLDMPRPIIEACLIYHQKFFPVEDKPGNLLNNFVGVRDGISEYLKPVRKGFEKVLIARLQDAEFFFKKDRRYTLKEHVENLKGVDFARDLGTLYDKAGRVKELSGYIARLLKRTENFKRRVEKLSLLCKADFTTLTVEEFPELEGIIGRIYAALDGEDEEVSRGIEQHYMPRSGGDKIPPEDTAAVVGIADRVDTLCGNLGKGVKATGSEDPFGLRRTGKGLVRILLKKGWNLDLKNIVQKSFKEYFKQEIKFRDSKQDTVIKFLAELSRQELKGNFKYDIVRCVMASDKSSPVELKKRALAVEYIRKEKDFDSLITAFKRINNILKQAGKKDIDIPKKYDGRCLVEKTEKKLDEKYSEIVQEIGQNFQGKNYKIVLEKLISLREDIDKYFDEVMVMTDDIERCKNRLAMLKNIKEIFKPVGDIARLELK